MAEFERNDRSGIDQTLGQRRCKTSLLAGGASRRKIEDALRWLTMEPDFSRTPHSLCGSFQA
jgi:hypothetical protein